MWDVFSIPPFSLSAVFDQSELTADEIDQLKQLIAKDSMPPPVGRDEMLGPLKVDVILDSLSSNPRFKSILQRLGFRARIAPEEVGR